MDRNRPPQTFLVAAPVDTSVADIAYSYRIHLYWRGEDSDGYVVGFEYSWDDSSIGAFKFTTKTDSIFELTVNDSSQLTGGTGQNPSTARTHTFYIRAVDNLGKPDPSLTIFNRRPFKAQTVAPVVTFTGAIPNPKYPAVIDTVCEGTPFSVSWQGRDPDGVVTRYRFDVGAYHSPLTTDSSVTFNDPGAPGSINLASGIYTMSVTAIDNANAVGTGTTQFVVNHDPETEIARIDANNLVGHYIQHFLGGQEVHIEGTFTFDPNDSTPTIATVPYRSTVWWSWDGEDSHGGCESNCINGYSIVLNGGRNDHLPYIVGFQDSLGTDPEGNTIHFKTNDPAVLGPLGFSQFILDSLDAGIDIIARVAARDCSNRADGTPAAFRFNCNYYPTLESVTVEPTTFDFDGSGPDPVEPAQLIRWVGLDYEDGKTKNASVLLDDTLTLTFTHFEDSTIVSNRDFQRLSTGTDHTVKVRVSDRADFLSKLPDGQKQVSFTIPLTP
ncbi:MAG TPA: PKD domain-containing protein [Candidatus Eisenbacteria bacterium]|nr:PKD domain-containing protein [Candidatus Eisenbacteria bacterium]